MSSTLCLVCYPKYEESHTNEDYEVISDCDLSTDDNTSEEELDPHNRDTRATKPRHPRPRKHSQRHRQTRIAQSTSTLLMPSGRLHAISDLVEPKWHCGTRTKLVTLKKVQREFTLVAREMQKTIVQDDNCESAGGCFEKYNIVQIQKVLHGCAWRKYVARKLDIALEAGAANERMLFHGTDAVWSVVRGGFDERYASTNGTFGAGLYFAQHSSISNKFVFGYFGGNGCPKHQDKNCFICERHLFLCRVTLGSELKLESIQNMPHPPPGHHSVTAVPTKDGFQYPEYIIYRGEQAYPEYLITYKIVKIDKK